MTGSISTRIEGTCDWTGTEIKNDPRWRFDLSDTDIAEIERADAALKARGVDLAELDAMIK